DHGFFRGSLRSVLSSRQTPRGIVARGGCRRGASMTTAGAAGSACPVPRLRYERVVLGHGSGGRLSHDLLRHVILDELAEHAVQHTQDQATLHFSGGRL